MLRFVGEQAYETVVERTLARQLVTRIADALPEHEEIRTRVRDFIQGTVKPAMEGFDDEEKVFLSGKASHIETILSNLESLE